MKNLPSIALGTWSWGTGAVGGDQVFGNNLDAEKLKPVFYTARQLGLNLWDTATVYGMGASEKMLGDTLSCDSFDGIGKIFRGDIQFRSIICHHSIYLGTSGFNDVEPNTIVAGNPARVIRKIK